VEDITKDRSDMVKLAGTNKQTGGGIKCYLQAAGDLCQYAVFESIIIVNPGRKAAARV